MRIRRPANTRTDQQSTYVISVMIGRKPFLKMRGETEDLFYARRACAENVQIEPSFFPLSS